MRPLLSIFFAIAMSVFFVAPLHADQASRIKEGQCNTYGADAVDQATRAETLKCGFNKGSPANSTDVKVHKNWCMSAKPESVNYERSERKRRVNDCAGCKAYADGANRAARENVAFRCGFEGPRWGFGDGSENDGHYLWCLSGTMDYVDGDLKFTSGADVGASENAARAAALKQCRAKIKDRFTDEERRPCIDYAKTAAAKANVNVSKKCGATPVLRWSRNEREHFEACIFVGEAGKAFLAEEAKIRENGVRVCTAGLKLTPDGDPIGTYGTFKGAGGKPKVDPDKMKALMTPRGGDNTSTNPSTSKSKGGSSAMERLGGGTIGGGGSLPGRPAGGSDKSKDNAGTNKPAGTSSGGSGAMERLGGGPSGGVSNVYPGGTPGSKSKPSSGGAAIITPAQPAIEPKKDKTFGRAKDSSIDYGFSNPPPPPKPYLR